LYIIYAIILRPFKEHENNIIEIFNEFVFAFLIIICFSLPINDKNENNFFISYILREEIMSYTVIFSSLLVALITTVTLTCTQILKLKRYETPISPIRHCQKSKTQPKTPNLSHSKAQSDQSKPRIDTKENLNFSQISKNSSHQNLQHPPANPSFFYKNRLSIEENHE